MIFDEFNDLPFQDISRNVEIEENIENLEISQESQETNREVSEKEIQLEVILPQMETQVQDGESSNLPKEWRFVHNHPTNLIIGNP